MAQLKKANSGNDLEKVVDQLDSEDIRQINDVQVSEDGYVHDEPLLAGYLDPKTGIRHTTFTYREMNGRDEEAINKAEVKANGAKIVNVLVERCVTEIGTLTKKDLGTKKWGEVVRALYGGDLDYIAMKLREISKGKEVTFEHKCSNCNSKLQTIINTDEFGITPFGGLDEVSFELPRGYKDKKGNIHREGTMRLMTGFDREIVFPMFKRNMATASTMLFTRLMKLNDNVPILNDCVSNMTLRDREYLEKIIMDTTFGLDTNIEVTCATCGADLSGEVGTSNFF